MLMKSLLIRRIGIGGAARFGLPKTMAPAVAKSFSTYFLESHEYVKVDGAIATIGITKIAAEALGDVVFIELPAVGAKFNASQPFGSVESVKAASNLYSPVEGEVIEINKALEANPTIVNTSPLEEGWMIKIKLNGDYDKAIEDMLEDGSLLDQELYDKHTAVPYYTDSNTHL